MSKYLEDTQGKIVSNPINETNTKYPFIDEVDGVKPTGESKLDYQYMSNDQPVSDIDTGVYDDYRHTVEDLRHKTETWYESLQKCMVPAQIEGMAFQPYTLTQTEDGQGNITVSKTKALQYFFQDHDVLIGQGSKEYVFRTNQVKFIDDRRRRLIYDRKIHILTQKEDELAGLTTDQLIKRDFYFYRERNDSFSPYVSKVTDLNTNKYASVDDILELILDNNEKVMIIDDGAQRQATSVSDLRSHTLANGQDLDTGIPSTLYNLHNIGWVHPSMIFLNGVAISWTKILISVDSIDTFVIATHLSDAISNYLDDEKDIEMEYVHIPFKCIYTIGAENAYYTYKAYMNDQGKFDSMPPFIINKDYGGLMLSNDERYKNSACPYSNCDRVCCIDKSIIFMDMNLDDGTDKEKFLSDIGIVHNKSLRSFCDGDYRYKLKRFNFLGFKVDEDLSSKTGTSNTLLTLKNDDFNVDWHPFNILDIKFDHLRNGKRLFKIFYNKEVLYDQDNILRIKNKTEIGEEYERYRQDVTANIETYINEIYFLAKRDIGSYVVTDENAYTYKYKYHYVTPYETFLLYNEIITLLGGQRITLDQFKTDINVSDNVHPKKSGGGGGGGGGGGDGIHYDEYVYVDDFDDEDESDIPDDQQQDEGGGDEEETKSFVDYMHGAFIIYDDDHNFFNEMVKESTLFDEHGNLKQEIADFWQSLIDNAELNTITDFLIPIDNERRTDEIAASNAYYMYEGDTRGKLIPFTHFSSYLGIKQVDTKTEYDHLKLRFELDIIHNMEEGATPIDELIFYYDNNGLENQTQYPVVESYDDRYTANVLNALAWNIFKNDPHNVVNSIVKLNYMGDYIVPRVFEGDFIKDNFIVTLNSDVPTIGYEYQKDPRFFYNYGVYEYPDSQDNPKRIQSEWALRRNLPEMFFYSLDMSSYTIKSMHLLDEVFDFTYDPRLSYIDNLKNGANYIIGYDADKLEASIKRSIVSMTKTGKELKQHKNSNPNVTKYTIDGYKMITFVENNNYQLAYNNVMFNAYEEDDGSVSIMYKPENSNEFVTVIGAGDIECKYGVLINPLITINFDTHTIYDIDHDVTALFFSYRFNHETGLLEFLDLTENVIVTMQVDSLSTKTKLEMSRWNISSQDNYVMIFKNHKLYEKYYTIQYTRISFIVDMLNSDAEDTDVFEFVFFLNANNTVVTTPVDGQDQGTTIVTEYASDGTVVSTDTIYNTSKIVLSSDVIDPTNLQVLIDTMPADPNDKWTVEEVTNTAYEIGHEIYSYQATTDNTGATRSVNYSLQKDNKVNGTYRITKQNSGGEYVVEYNSTVPEKTESYTGDPNGFEYVPDDRTDIGIGTQAFGSPNEITINFNGTVDEWKALAKANPITINGGYVICSNGTVELVEDITVPVTPPNPAPEEEETPEEET